VAFPASSLSSSKDDNNLMLNRESDGVVDDKTSSEMLSLALFLSSTLSRHTIRKQEKEMM
jgi:hypothetical protein